MISGLSPVNRVTVTIDGEKYEGTYFVQNYMVHVLSQFGAKAAQLGSPSRRAAATPAGAHLQRRRDHF